MPTKIPLNFYENNDEVVHGVILDETNNPEDCTGKSVEFLYKTSASMADADAVVIAGVFTDILSGACDFFVPRVYVIIANKFYHIDVIDNDIRRTAGYGPVNMVDL